MRLPLLVSAGVLLVALLPCPPCRALRRGPVPGVPQAPQPLDFFQPQPPPSQPQQPQPRPILLRMGEEYFLRLGNLGRSPVAALSPASSPLAGAGSGGRPLPDQAAANFFRVLLQQLPLSGRSLDSRADPSERGAEGALGGHQEAPERERRSEEPPISLDLTFHLLREVLEMARAEQLAQQAHSNRKLMEIIGK